jgi:hypothetical protein
MELPMISYTRYLEERAELESLNADVPSLADTKPSRLKIKPTPPEKCLMYHELTHLPRSHWKKPTPMFTKPGKKPKIKAKKANARFGPASKRKKKVS